MPNGYHSPAAPHDESAIFSSGVDRCSACWTARDNRYQYSWHSPLNKKRPTSHDGCSRDDYGVTETDPGDPNGNF